MHPRSEPYGCKTKIQFLPSWIIPSLCSVSLSSSPWAVSLTLSAHLSPNPLFSSQAPDAWFFLLCWIWSCCSCSHTAVLAPAFTEIKTTGMSCFYQKSAWARLRACILEKMCAHLFEAKLEGTCGGLCIFPPLSLVSCVCLELYQLSWSKYSLLPRFFFFFPFSYDKHTLGAVDAFEQHVLLSCFLSILFLRQKHKFMKTQTLAITATGLLTMLYFFLSTAKCASFQIF